MAKEQVICPFSKKLCAECALYRGRHYFLCYCQTYRGYLGNQGKHGRQSFSRKDSNFEMPDIKTTAMDPFLRMNEEDKEGEIR
jgi:hypothetical protein